MTGNLASAREIDPPMSWDNYTNGKKNGISANMLGRKLLRGQIE